MTNYLNNNVHMPWVWSVAQRLEQQPRQLKMWGSIPYHAHNFLIRFTFGVRTTIGLMIIKGILLKNEWGYGCRLSQCRFPCRYQGCRRRRLSSKTISNIYDYISCEYHPQFIRVMTNIKIWQYLAIIVYSLWGSYLL